MRGEFVFEAEAIALPGGAFAGGHRRLLTWRGRVLLGLTQGPFRPYLFPVASPAGHLVVAERPPDHPHHSGLWIAADHVSAHLPAGAAGQEIYSYNFYVDHVFQGRAPGRIVARETTGEAAGEAAGKSGAAERFRITQSMDWIGPPEWGAPEGRLVARESRVHDIRPGDRYHLIDVVSTFQPAQWPLTLGPTRHAYFNARAAESMRLDRGGAMRDAAGREGGEAITEASAARWVRVEGPLGAGARAGLALIPGAGTETDWFAADWGVVTAQPWRSRSRHLPLGDCLVQRARYVVHDGADIDFTVLAEDFG